MSVDPLKGSDRELNFWETHDLGIAVREVTIRGPWGPREVTLESDGGMALTHYEGAPLWKGYWLPLSGQEIELQITVK